MKWLLISAIHLYKKLPRWFKRKCIFKETCSSHVLRMTRESGFRAGMRNLTIRMLQCRRGYVVLFDGNLKHWVVRFANGSVAGSGEVADFVLAPYTPFSVGMRESDDVIQPHENSETGTLNWENPDSPLITNFR